MEWLSWDSKGKFYFFFLTEAQDEAEKNTQKGKHMCEEKKSTQLYSYSSCDNVPLSNKTNS